MSKEFSVRDYIRHAVILIVVFLSAFMTLYAVASSRMADRSKSGIILAADGDAFTPFVYRMLLPQISNLAKRITPQTVQESLTTGIVTFLETPLVSSVVGNISPSKEMWQPHNFYRIIWVVGMMWGALIVYALALRRLAQQFWPERGLLIDVVPLYGLLTAIPFIFPRPHLYDFPVLAFSALLLLFMVRQNWGLYLTTFMFACLNKETAILFTIVFMLYSYPLLGWRQFLFLLLWQVTFWVAAMYGTHTLFADNRHWNYRSDFVVFWKEIGNWKAPKLLYWAVSGYLLFAKWREIPIFLKKAMILLPIMIVLYLRFGVFREYRVFYEALPPFTLISIYTIFRLMNVPFVACKHGKES